VRSGISRHYDQQSGMLALGERQVVTVQLGPQPLTVQHLADGAQPGRVQRGEGLAPPHPQRLL